MSPPRRARARKAQDISELQWAFLNDALDRDDPRREEQEYRWRFYELECNTTLGENRPIVDDLWRTYGPYVLARWAVEKPGTRPSLWWKYDAPRMAEGTYPGWYFDGSLPEPRRRLGGTGSAAHDVLSYVPQFACGIPLCWITTEDVARYTGKVKVRHGHPVEWDYPGKTFKGVAIDPNDPPLYEAQATYLDRHGLLLPGEAERLTKADYEPTRVSQ